MANPKRLLILLLAVCMFILPACGGDDPESTLNPQNTQGSGDASTPGQAGSGRYVETDITPPIQGRFASFLSGDGRIVCYDAGLKTRYESADGGATWSEEPGPGSGANLYEDVLAGTLLEDGRLLAYIQESGLCLIHPDGSSEPFSVAEIDQALANGESVMIQMLQALDQNRLALGYTIGGMMMQTRREGPQGGEGGMPGDAPPEGATPGAGGMPGDMPPEGAMLGEGPGTGSGPSDDTQGVRGTQRTAISGPMMMKTLLIDLTSGAVVAELPVENAASAASDADSLYIMDAFGTVAAFSLADGAPSDKPGVAFGGSEGGDGRTRMVMNMNASGGLLSLGEEGSLYAVHEKSVLRVGADGQADTVLESTAYSIGDPRAQLDSLFVLPGGDIVVNLVGSGQIGRLYKYVWDDNATIDPDKRLAIWSLEDNNFVRAAITQLRKENPDASISYEVALEGDNAFSAADAIKTLNTRLLSGSGPDVILLDGCPVDSYVDKGMLLELSGLLDTGDIYDNLLEPYGSDGALYCLPTQFMMPALMGSADALAQAGSLEELVELVVHGNDPSALTPGMGLTQIPQEERAALHFNDLRELCQVLWLSSAPSIVSENRLDTDALRTFLQATKAISDKYALTQTGEARVGLAVSVFDGGIATQLPGSLVRYTSQLTNYGAFTAGDLQLLQMMMERAGSELTLFPGLTPGAWEPSTVAGISADTPVAPFAAEFLQTMLSLDMQSLNYATGMPVTRAGIAAQIENINQRLAENDQPSFDFDVEALIGRLKTPSMGDTALTDMMWSTVERCCKGEVDVEGAVKEIEQNVKNYLAERA